MATKAVKVTYTDIKPCILSTKDGVEKDSFFPKLGDNIDHGDVEGKINWPMCVSAVSICLQHTATDHATHHPFAIAKKCFLKCETILCLNVFISFLNCFDAATECLR